MKKGSFFLVRVLSVLLIFILSQLLFYSSAQISGIKESHDNPGFRLLQQNEQRVKLRHSVIDVKFSDITINGRQMVNVHIPGCFLPNNEGAPNLPGNGRYIAIPQGAQASYRIISEKTKTYRNIELAPAPKIPKETDDGPLEYTFDSTIYKRNAFYPAEPVIISSPQKIRGVDVVIVGVTPFQYNPVTKELIVYEDLKIEVNFEGGRGRIGEDRLRSRWWDPVHQNMVLNHQSLPEIDYSQRNGSRSNGYEYIIISPNDPTFLSWADSLRRFRIRQGISTQIVTTAEIGGNNAEAIENYIDNAYNNWSVPPVAVLLLGDYGTSGNTIVSPVWNSYCISDNIYADVDNDDLPDIYMARITAQNETDLSNMIGKILNYERQPPTDPGFYQNPVVAGGWQTERWFTLCSEVIQGFWENELGKEPVREYAIYSGTPGNIWSTNPNTQTVVDYFGPGGLEYVPGSPSYLNDWGGNATRINNDINSGAFMVVHRDHGYEYGWGEPYYNNSSLEGLNNDFLPFVFSLNCLTGKFNISGDCFTEAFHRPADRALGVIAATEVSYSFVNDAYTWGMWDNMWSEFDPGYGTTNVYDEVLPCFANAYGKYYLESSSWPYNPQHKVYTDHLFHHHGGAFSTVFTEVPQALNVSHDLSIIAGTTLFTVTADPYSTICLSSDTNILAVATGTGLPIDLIIPVLTHEDTLILTITKQNYFRYQKLIEILQPEGPWVIYNSYLINDEARNNGNGEMDYGESILLTLVMKNFGNEQADAVDIVLHTNDPYIVFSDSVEYYGDIPPDSIAFVIDGFAFDVSLYIPDGHEVQFEAEAIGEDTWSTFFNITAHAPSFWLQNNNLDFGNVLVGDTGKMVFMIKNRGSLNLSGTIETPDNFHVVSYDDNIIGYDLSPSESQNFVLNFIPSQLTSYQDSILITSIDPNHATNYLYVSGAGTVYHPTNLSAELDIYNGEVDLIWEFDTIPGFSEDFENGNADNFLFNDPGISVSDGYLKMSGPFESLYACAMYDEDFQDYILEYEVTKMQGSTAHQGVFFGAFIRSNGFINSGYESGYSFDININGRYRIYRYFNGGRTTIRYSTSNAINTGLGATNVIRIAASESDFELYINGVFVHGFTDYSFLGPGKVNVYSYRDSEGEIWWDYISLAPIDSYIDGADQSRLAGTFDYFNIYRNGSVLDTTSFLEYTDALTAYGSYMYEVAAVYNIGESASDGSEMIYWNGYPEISVLLDSLLADLQSGESETGQVLTIGNTGDSTLIFKINISDTIDSRSIWDLQFSYPVKIGEGEAGIETDGNFQYTSKWNNNIFFKYGMNGTFAGSFTIEDCSQIRDLAWDGTYFYGAAANTQVCIMDFESQELIGTIDAPCDTRAIAYNDDLDAFFANNYNTDITLFDRDGNILNSFSVGLERNYYGFAYDNFSFGGPFLWGFSNDCSGGTLVQIDAVTGEETGVEFDVVADLGATSVAGGLYIHPNIVGGKVTIGGLLQNDRMFGYELTDYQINNWISPDPVSGFVESGGGSLDIDITFDASDLNAGDYYAHMNIFCNDPGNPMVTIPAHLHVTGTPEITVAFEYDSTSSRQWSIDDTSTVHSFSPLFLTSGEAILSVIINGDYNGINEYAKVFLEDSMVATINPNVLSDVTRIIPLSESILNSCLLDSNVVISIVNSPEVDPGWGTDIHAVSLKFNSPEVDTVRFGEVIVGNSVQKALWVSNRGTDVLNISDIQITNTNYSTDATSMTLNPGESDTIIISFTPDDYLLIEGVLSITSDDPNNPLYDLVLEGTGVYPPEINVDPDAFDEDILVGYILQEQMSISNSGASNLFVDIYVEYTDALEPVIASSAPKIPKKMDDGDCVVPPYGLGEQNSLTPYRKTKPDSMDENNRSISDSIYYDDGNSFPQFMFQAYPSPTVCATRFTTESMFTLTHTRVYYRTENSPDPVLIEIYYGGDIPTEGVLIHQQLHNEYAPNGRFFYIPLYQHFMFYGGEDFWIVMRYPSSIQSPQGLDQDVTNSDDRCYHKTYNNAWTELSQPGAFLIRAIEDIDWLAVLPAEATIPASLSADIDVFFDATSLNPGVYTADLLIDNNDPADPQVIVPVSLTVSGTPEILAYPSSLSYDTTFTGSIATDTLAVYNVGTDVLTVNNIISDLSDFTVDMNSFQVSPADVVKVAVYFSPQTSGIITGNLNIYSDDLDDPELAVQITGIGIDPPVISVSPGSQSEVLVIGDTLHKQMEVSNNGVADLDVNFVVDYEDPRSPTDSIYYDDGNQYSDSWVGYNSAFPFSVATRFTPEDDFTLTHANVLFRTQTSTEQVGLEVFLGGATPDLGTSILQQIFSGISEEGQMFRIPLDQHFNFSSGQDFWIVMHYDISIPYPQGTDDTGNNCADRCYYSSNQGETWYYLDDLLGDGEPDAWIIRAIEDEFSDWLSVEPQQGTIHAAQPGVFEIIFDATHVSVGTFNADILVNSNDPVLPQLSVPVLMTVEGSPVIAFNKDSVPFDTAFVDETIIDSVLITNAGTDTLKITNIVANQPVFTIDTLNFSLLPLEQINVNISFTPGSPQFYNSFFTIYCNDPENPVISFPVSGTGVFPPIIGFTPGSLFKTLFTDFTGTDSVTIYNNGSLDLTYTSSITYISDERNTLELNRGTGDILLDLDIQTPTGCYRHLGGEFDGEYIYSTGSCSPNQVFKFDIEGNLIASYEQGTTSTWGMRDMAFKDGFLYAGDEDGFYRFDPSDGEVETIFTGNLGLDCIRALAYKPGLGFFSNNWGGDIVVFDENANILDNLADPGLTSTYGMAYDNKEDCLWLFDSSGDPTTTLYQYDIMSESLTDISYQLPLLSGATDQSTGGAFLTDELIDGKVVIGGVTQGDPLDRIFALELRDRFTWLSIEFNGSGTITQSGSSVMEIGFDADGLESGVYEAFIQIASNDPENTSDTIPVSLMVNDENSPAISGTITDGRAGIQDVSIGGVLTDLDGDYSAYVPLGWTGTLTPFKGCYSFDPPARTYQNMTSNETGQDYIALMSGDITISGTILADGVPLPAVAVLFEETDIVYTDINGEYVGTVECGWSGSVSALDSCYSFYPESINFTSINSNQSDKDFNGTLLGPFLISGIIDDGSDPLENVAVIFDGLDTIYTDANGSYSRYIQCCWTGTIVPEMDDLVFVPGSRSINCIGSDQMNLDFTGGDFDQHELSISLGWSGISSYIDPYDPLVVNIFDPVVDDMVILMDGPLVYWPALNINSIIGWNSHHGYKIKVMDNVQVAFTGYQEENKTLDLPSGWSTFPVLCETSVLTSIMFDPIEDTLVIIKQVAGGLIYWPALDIFSLINLEPGKAYDIKLNWACSVTFPERGYGGQNVYYMGGNPTPWNDVFETSITHIIAVKKEEIESIRPGDWIGAFTTEDLCSGMAEVPAETGSFALTVYGDDITTPDLKDGFSENESFKFRVYRPDTKEEFYADATFDPGLPNHDGVFLKDGLSSIIDLELHGIGIGEAVDLKYVQIYPNPATDRLYVTYQADVILEIRMFDAYGKEVIRDQIVSSSFINTEQISSGVYFVEIMVPDKSQRVYKKVVIQ